jgi:TATA-binding protein-associated factor Taf7
MPTNFKKLTAEDFKEDKDSDKEEDDDEEEEEEEEDDDSDDEEYKEEFVNSVDYIMTKVSSLATVTENTHKIAVMLSM